MTPHYPVHRGPRPGGQAIRLAGLVTALLLPLLAPMPGLADEAEEEAACHQAVAQTQALLVHLPADDPSRRFAESNLLTALAEMASGEVDECPDLVARAREVIETRPYRLRPGETMHGYGPDRPN